MEKPESVVAFVDHRPEDGKVYLWLAQPGAAAGAPDGDAFMKASRSSWLYASGAEICGTAEPEYAPGYANTGVVLELGQCSWLRLASRIERGFEHEGVGFKLAKEEPSGVALYGAETYPPLDDCSLEAGSFEVPASGELWAGDPCYEKESSWLKLNAAPGSWKARAVLRQDGDFCGNGLMPARLEVSLEGEPPVDPKNAKLFGEAGVDSARLSFRTARPSAQASDDGFGGDLGDDAPCMAEKGGFVSLTFYGDGSYPMFVREDAQGRVVAATLVTDPLDPLFYPGEKELMEQRRELARAEALADYAKRAEKGAKKKASNPMDARKARRAARRG